MKWIIAALICLPMCACSTARHRAAGSPDLSSTIKRSNDITETITLAQTDSKEIKKAIRSLQESSILLRKLNGDAVIILDRSDYKAKLLLEK